MTVFSLRTDQCLTEYQRYQAEFLSDDPNDARMRVSYLAERFDGFKPDVRTCVRRLGVDILDCWEPKSSHGPYDFDA